MFMETRKIDTSQELPHVISDAAWRSILPLLCFCVLWVGCERNNWETRELEDISEFHIDVSISEGRPALVNFAVTVYDYCVWCLKSPLVIFYARDLSDLDVIHLFGKVTVSSDCRCSYNARPLTTSTTMVLPVGEYTVLAGGTVEIIFRINSDSSEIVSKQYLARLPETE